MSCLNQSSHVDRENEGLFCSSHKAAELRCEFLTDANPRFLVVMFSIASELPAKTKDCNIDREEVGVAGHRVTSVGAEPGGRLSAHL